MRSLPVVSLLGLLLLGPTARAQDELPSPLPAGNFGWSVAVDRNTAAVGAWAYDLPGENAGAVFVHSWTGSAWQLDAVLQGSDTSAGDAFGTSLALAGDRLVVGGTDAGGGGAAYVFDRAGTTWTQAAKLVPSDPAAGDRFGSAVAMDGSVLVVGASHKALGAVAEVGAAYVFENVAGVWTQTAKLLPETPAASLHFGFEGVAASGDTVAVGAPAAGTATGAVHVYDRSGGLWTEAARLVPPGVAPGALFGWRVVLEGDRLVASAPEAVDLGPCSGAVFVYERAGAGWSLAQQLLAPDGSERDGFGLGLALEGSRLAVGASGDESGSGSVYLFELAAGAWSAGCKLRAADGEENDNMARAVALGGDRVVAGAIDHEHSGTLGRGVAYVFDLAAPNWSPFDAYCASTPNSTGGAAAISATGSASVLANDLVLEAGPVPDIFGLFYYGTDAAEVPFGNGVRCIGGAVYRLSVVPITGNLLSTAVDYAQLEPSGAIAAGSSWRFQAWFRDPAGGGAAFDLSDGLLVSFCP